jgi:hypothetical protein
MYCAIGEATTAWSAVENQLANIFAYLITGDGRSLGAKAAFQRSYQFQHQVGDDG